jgi:hypothetical protein
MIATRGGTTGAAGATAGPSGAPVPPDNVAASGPCTDAARVPRGRSRLTAPFAAGRGRAAWTSVLGCLLFVGMMATGYFYNITFVQLGLVDLGARPFVPAWRAAATPTAAA